MASTRTSKTAGENKTDDGVPSGTVQPVIAVNGVEPDTSVQAEPATAAPEEPPKMAELSGIRYVGFADVKVLSKEDLISLGAEDPKGDLRWDASNDKVVSTKEFNASTRDVLLGDPTNFVVS